MLYKTIEDFIGNTPLVRLQRLPGDTSNTLLVKLEGNNPAGSVKDRPALSMIRQAEARGQIKPGDTLIEATSGNTGIALAMAAAISGYRMILVMPENMSMERRAVMKAYGAELVLTPKEGSMEAAIDKARELEGEGVGLILDQFSNIDNPASHSAGTGPEIWRDTSGEITHFVSAMGTTGTIMGASRYLKSQNPAIEIVGVQPQEGRASPVFAAGLRPICQRSTMPAGSTGSSTSPRRRPSRPLASWQRERGSSAASLLVVRWRRRWSCRSR
ncbi:cysteine synthase B [endosymbiont of Riftia pachyptila (vent Ph05)]|uniref:Cysteine synthase B n=1 Tax=endosymbiont of Riftia pachyptila (vent Ph05) TaxID=1048808 RepID=G2DAD4_9GAMM|nr:cysteine synthase B [endosymbiont of Riftia pachyptila (vent Ph05)]